MSFKAEDLRVGDVLAMRNESWFGVWVQPPVQTLIVKEIAHRWQFRVFNKIDPAPIVLITGMGYGSSHTERKSALEINSALKHPSVSVHRDGKQIYPVSETAHTDADMSANFNREEG